MRRRSYTSLERKWGGLYQALYRKWRPQTFTDVVGQEHITATLRRQVAEGRLSHAYLFTGTRGTGKTTCAKILAKAVNCEHPIDGNPCNACPTCLGIDAGTLLDVMELDAASNNGVDNVRTLRDEAVYSPAQARRRVYIIDEVHMLTREAFNALLKILEEPPEHLMFILATTELHKVPPTILSRCQRFAFRRILPQEIVARLSYVAGEEGIDLRSDGAELLSRLADGALRDALSLLDQCAAGGGVIDGAAVLETLGLAGNIQTAQLCEYVLRRDSRAALLLLGSLYAGGKDVGAVLGELGTLLRDLLIRATAPEGGAALLSGGYDAASLERLGSLVSPARLIQLSTVLQKALSDLAFSVNRRTDAELCLLRLCDESLSGDLTALCARVARLEEQLAAGAAFARAQSKDFTPVPAEQTPSAPVEQAAPLPEEDDAPAGEEDDGPPPYGELVMSADPSPAESAGAVPAVAAKADSPAADDGEVYAHLMESYKNRLPKDKRAFIGATSGVVTGEVLTVYCPTELHRSRLDQRETAEIIEEVTAAAIGRAVRVRFLVGPAPGGSRDKMQELLRMGSKFNNITIK